MGILDMLLFVFCYITTELYYGTLYQPGFLRGVCMCLILDSIIIVEPNGCQSTRYTPTHFTFGFRLPHADSASQAKQQPVLTVDANSLINRHTTSTRDFTQVAKGQTGNRTKLNEGLTRERKRVMHMSDPCMHTGLWEEVFRYIIWQRSALVMLVFGV